MGLQETLRRTCAQNTTHAAPRNAPAAHPPAQSLSTPVPAHEGCVCARAGGAARRPWGGGGEARAAPLWELAPWQLSPPPPPVLPAASGRPLTCAGQERGLVGAQARGKARRLWAGAWAGPLLLLLPLTLRLLLLLPQPLWLRPTRRV